MTRPVTCSMTTSLDGYIVGPDGRFDWMPPGEDVFRFATDEVRALGVHLLGRRLYESMVYWETVDAAPPADPTEEGPVGIPAGAFAEFAALWQALPKVVFSTTLSTVEGKARLATGGLAGEIGRLRAEPGDGAIAIGGATLAAEAAALGLIDEYRVRVLPVLVGGGTPFFPQAERRVDLELLDTRTFGNGVVFLHHRVVR